MKQTDWLRELLANLPPALEEPPIADPDLHFDPDRDDLGDVIGRLSEFASNYYSDWAEALAWLDKTVGLDFSDLQARLGDVPIIPVPKHVSDSLNEPRRLFGYLDQIRLAYVVGADLAAIALCRVVTELLVRNHYASGVQGAKITTGRGRTGLTWLIEQVQEDEEFRFLRNFNLVDKVKEANEILHNPSAADIEHRNRARGVAMCWIRVLDEMISRVPVPGC
jgi:hypothetical protein